MVNTIIVYAILVLGFFSILAAVYTLNKSREHIYVMSQEGNIIPLKLQQRRDNLKVEAYSHITTLIDNFYRLDQSKVSNMPKSSLEIALWQGDFEEIHKYRFSSNFYQNCIQYNVIYTPQIIEIKVSEPNNGIFDFIANFDLIISGTKGIKTEKLIYSLSGKIRTTQRQFPYNPHGLYLFNIKENKKQYED